MPATYGGFGAASAGVGARTPGVPAGVVTGSLSLLLECVSTSTTRTAGPSGGNGTWVNELFNQNGNGTLYCDQKVATGSDAGPTYSVGGNAVQSSTAICVRIDGSDNTDPIFGTPASGAGSTSTAAAVSINSVPAGACLIWFFRCSGATPTVTTPPAGFTMISAGASAFHLAKLDNFTGGNTGSLTATMSGATNHRTMLVAVNPTPAATGTFTGAYAFAGSGFAGAAGPGRGTFAGGYNFTGAGFTGDRVSVGSFTGGFSFAGGPFTGAAGAGEGNFTGGYDFTGSNFVGVAGAPSAYGFFNGGYDFTGGGFAGSAPSDNLVNVYGTEGGRKRFGGRK